MKTALSVAVLIAVFVAVSPAVVHAESETCDRFSFAVSGSRLNDLPVTVLRGGLSPVLEIAGKPYNYDIANHCLSESGAKARDCSKPLKVMDGKKVVALIEGTGRVSISPVDEKGQRDLAQPSYSVFVARDVSAPARPRFVVEAINTDGKILGRIDGVEGMTASEMAQFKGKLASAHKLIDLRSKNLVYANCRKLAIMRFDESNSKTTKMIALARAETSGATSNGYMPAHSSRPNRAMASTLHLTKYGSTTSASVAPPPQEYQQAPPLAMDAGAPPMAPPMMPLSAMPPTDMSPGAMPPPMIPPSEPWNSEKR